MTDRPISFKAPMIRALLAGNKTQTRRLIKPQPDLLLEGQIPKQLRIQIDDRLWVKEAWRAQEYFDDMSPSEIGAAFMDERGDPYAPVFYEATKSCDGSSIEQWQQSELGRLRASMHMTRWASRLTLIVTDVRVQRLQDISEEDAIAEGIRRSSHGNGDQWLHNPEGSSAAGWLDPRQSYASLWDSINKDRCPWESNPWIVAYSFTVHRCNIDQMEGANG